MTDINRLTRVDQLSVGDLLPIWHNGGTFSVDLTTLVAFIQAQLASGAGFITQYAAPAATGFSVLVAPLTQGVPTYLLLTPVGAYAAGTIVLPDSTTLNDGQEVLVSTTQAVAALTVSANGAAAVNGAPAALAQFGFFRLRYDGVLQSWNRVG